MLSRPIKWTTPNWVKNFRNWTLGFTDSNGRELSDEHEEASDERSGYDYGNEGSPDHPQFMSDKQRAIERECLANL